MLVESSLTVTTGTLGRRWTTSRLPCALKGSFRPRHCEYRVNWHLRYRQHPHILRWRGQLGSHNIPRFHASHDFTLISPFWTRFWLYFFLLCYNFWIITKFSFQKQLETLLIRDVKPSGVKTKFFSVTDIILYRNSIFKQINQVR